MGILTNSSLGKKHKLEKIVNHKRKICGLIYMVGIVWFFVLSHPAYNHPTYLSENALSPGLVYSETRADIAKFALNVLEDLNRERTIHKSTMPHTWLLAKLKQIGLETFVHNFTLHYPLAGGLLFKGKNVYGIIRAPRTASTEGILFSTPYRTPQSTEADITASVPLLMAFANFAKRQNYWAKDLIFLFTDQEQLGMHAWLEAYHYEGTKQSSVLDAGRLQGRSGLLQAAINVEIQDFDIDYLNVKIEGLNGQLPNLDLFNLVQRLAVKENIPSGINHSAAKKRNGKKNSMEANLKQIFSSILAQTNGVPTGNHGLFHRFRIEALTLEGIKRQSSSYQRREQACLSILKTLEGISRSLNNLLERFHQSYFFYILVSNDRFISIGDFIPSLLLMVATLFVKAFLMWISLEINQMKNKVVENSEPERAAVDYYKTTILIIGFHLLGGFLLIMPYKPLALNFLSNLVPSSKFVAILISVVSVTTLLMPFFLEISSYGRELLHIITLLELGTVLLVVGLLNFPLGLFLAALIAPVAIVIETEPSENVKRFLILITLGLNPAFVVYVIVWLFTLQTFREDTLGQVTIKAFFASLDAVTFAVVDSMIYGNWIFHLVTTALFPCWSAMWSILHLRKPVIKYKSV